MHALPRIPPRFHHAAEIIALAVVLAQSPPVALAQNLVIETADGSANDTGWYTSLVLDAKGDPHVSYADATDGNLKYAHKSGGIWMTETADASLNLVGEHTALALDAQGNPHVSYLDNTNGDLKYARKSNGTWIIETPDGSANVVGYWTSLALDVSGNPHVSYFDFTALDLKYARKSGGVWTREIVDGAANDAGRYSSLALDGSGNPHISYYDNTADNLKYASKSGGVWTLETADGSMNDTGSHSSLELDSAENPHISYQDDTTDDLKYARKVGGVWTRETADAALTDVGAYSSLALTAQDEPRITYYDSFPIENLKYARKVGGAWIAETLEASNTVGLFSSLALDVQGNLHVSYADATINDLKYAFVPSLVVSAPQSGTTWPVGSLQTVSWSYTGGLGTDISDVFLSVDGGRTFDLIRDNTRDFRVTIRVPHAPTRFAQVKVVQPSPFTVGYSDSFFTIDATIALLKFDATASPDGHQVALSWSTEPGPEADVHYRLERASAGTDVFAALHAGLLDRGEFVDAAPGASARYRLVAVNGLGEEYVLGETAIARPLAEDRLLAVAPSPAFGGSTSIYFRVVTDLFPVDLSVYDVSGRRVRSVESGTLPAGVHTRAWDGRDDSGNNVAVGTYFVRLAWGAGSTATERLIVVR